MTEQAVIYEEKDGVAEVTINRPRQLNAMNDAVIEGLHRAWLRFGSGSARVAVLRGAGDRAFSAGADLKAPPVEMARGIPGIGVVLEKPVIAAVDGHCIGGGLVLVQMCDLAVATERSTFSYPEIHVGYTGGLIAGLASRIPAKAALEIMLLGQTFSAARAEQWGVINRVVADGGHETAAGEWAAGIARGAPLVVNALKRLVDQSVLTRSATEEAARTRIQLAQVAESTDRLEGAAAFREKRQPVFEGR